MKTKKICLIGDFAVGKTSLVARFVNHTFSDKYLTTVGVSIKTKVVEQGDGESVKLIIWDVAGEDRFSSAAERYLRGANGLLVVADGTRAETLEAADNLTKKTHAMLGEIPTLRLINKADLKTSWVAGVSLTENIEAQSFGGEVATSAKSGLNVEYAFRELASMFG